MVAAQVEEGRDPEACALDPRKRECMRGDLERDPFDAFVGHLAQQSVKDRRFGRGESRGGGGGSPARPRRADAADASPGCTGDRFEHPGDRRLAVGAGDADQVEAFVGIPEAGSRQESRRTSVVVDLDPGGRGRPVRRRCSSGDDRGRAALTRLVGEAHAVDLLTAQREEQVSLSHAAGVQRCTTHIHVRTVQRERAHVRGFEQAM